MKPANTYLELTDIEHWFGDFHALKDISLEIREGELVCFLGPSGCGKTTLLRIIAGLEIQAAGRILQAGKDVSRLPVKKRDFGIVFQSYALFPNLSVAENIAYGLKGRGLGKKQRLERVTELLTMVGLPGSERKYPAQLSGGQQQRVALARALATSPGLLLLDEPLSALDARVRTHLRNEIKRLQERLGVTTIMVTHDQEEALTMADRIVVMNHGVIEQVGTPEEIYSRPRTPFVADFVGTMNFLSGHALKTGSIVVDDGNNPDTGSGARLAIRPEDVRLKVNGDRTNLLQGVVRGIEFLGSYVRSTLHVEGLDRPISADISMNEMHELQIREGQTLEFVLPRDRLLVFAEENA